MKPIPGLDANYFVNGWSLDGASVYAASTKGAFKKTAKVYKVSTATGKMELWRTFGMDTSGVTSMGAPRFSADGSAYAYVYTRVLSQAYVVTGLK